jgi:hypothetical protein
MRVVLIISPILNSQTWWYFRSNVSPSSNSRRKDPGMTSINRGFISARTPEWSGSSHTKSSRKDTTHKYIGEHNAHKSVELFESHVIKDLSKGWQTDSRAKSGRLIQRGWHALDLFVKTVTENQMDLLSSQGIRVFVASIIELLYRSELRHSIFDLIFMHHQFECWTLLWKLSLSRKEATHEPTQLDFNDYTTKKDISQTEHHSSEFYVNWNDWKQSVSARYLWPYCRITAIISSPYSFPCESFQLILILCLFVSLCPLSLSPDWVSGDMVD